MYAMDLLPGTFQAEECDLSHHHLVKPNILINVTHVSLFALHLKVPMRRIAMFAEVKHPHLRCMSP